jgi:hypothetical protein
MATTANATTLAEDELADSPSPAAGASGVFIGMVADAASTVGAAVLVAALSTVDSVAPPPGGVVDAGSTVLLATVADGAAVVSCVVAAGGTVETAPGG